MVRVHGGRARDAGAAAAAVVADKGRADRQPDQGRHGGGEDARDAPHRGIRGAGGESVRATAVDLRRMAEAAHPLEAHISEVWRSVGRATVRLVQYMKTCYF